MKIPSFFLWIILCLALAGTAHCQLAGTSFGAGRLPATTRSAINVLRVASAVQDGETVTIGAQVFEVDTTTVGNVGAGHVRLDLHGGSTVAASGTLTSNGTIMSDGDTFTVAAKVYTFKTALTGVEGQVLIAGSADAGMLDLTRAINHTGTPGTDYVAAAANTGVTAAATLTSHAFAVTARIPGTVGNALTLAESGTNLSVSGSGTLASGADPTAGEFTTAFTAAIQAGTIANFRYGATRISANEVLVTSYVPNGADATACTETLAGSNNTWAAATMYGGDAKPEDSRNLFVLSRAATATEAALLTMHFVPPYTPTYAVGLVRTAAGAHVAFDGTITITGNRIDVTSSGSTNVSSTNVVTIIAGN